MTALKFEDTATLGDTIKAFDFEPMQGRKDIFVLGKVTDIVTHINSGARCFVITCTNDSGKTDSNRVGKEVYIPLETGMDFDGRVVKIN